MSSSGPLETVEQILRSLGLLCTFFLWSGNRLLSHFELYVCIPELTQRVKK